MGFGGYCSIITIVKSRVGISNLAELRLILETITQRSGIFTIDLCFLLLKRVRKNHKVQS